jgi:hypothetical protein
MNPSGARYTAPPNSDANTEGYYPRKGFGLSPDSSSGETC